MTGLFPKVYLTGRVERVLYYGASDADEVKIKIQPMEVYSIPHTSKFRIDEEERYPYLDMTRGEDGAWCVEYTFSAEQRYTVCISVDGAAPRKGYIYAVDEALGSLMPMKGDTHLHTCRSDGEGTPLEVSIAYRSAGYDFIAVTDHHKMSPSIEAANAVRALTDKFTVIRGEEVHNKSMGYFHVVSLGASDSVNTLIETDDDYVEGALARIRAEYPLPPKADVDNCAWRIFIANEIHARGGIAVMAHPYWDVFGEYHMQTEDVRAMWHGGYYDALELLGGCDRTGNGNNIMLALWAELREEGVRVPVVGASDSHSTTDSGSLFNKQFTIAFVGVGEDPCQAIVDGRTVAVEQRSTHDFYCYGSLRLVKYARFLLDELYPLYTPLTEKHARAMALGEKGRARIAEAEREIEELRRKFYSFV